MNERHSYNADDSPCAPYPSKARVVTNESIANDGRMVPAALDLPPGKLFFGFTYKPFDPQAATVKKVEPEDGAGVRVPKFCDCRLSLRIRFHVGRVDPILRWPWNHPLWQKTCWGE